MEITCGETKCGNPRSVRLAYPWPPTSSPVHIASSWHAGRGPFSFLFFFGEGGGTSGEAQKQRSAISNPLIVVDERVVVDRSYDFCSDYELKLMSIRLDRDDLFFFLDLAQPQYQYVGNIEESPEPAKADCGQIKDSTRPVILTSQPTALVHFRPNWLQSAPLEKSPPWLSDMICLGKGSQPVESSIESPRHLGPLSWHLNGTRSSVILPFSESPTRRGVTEMVHHMIIMPLETTLSTIHLKLHFQRHASGRLTLSHLCIMTGLLKGIRIWAAEHQTASDAETWIESGHELEKFGVVDLFARRSASREDAPKHYASQAAELTYQAWPVFGILHCSPESSRGRIVMSEAYALVSVASICPSSRVNHPYWPRTWGGQAFTKKGVQKLSTSGSPSP
ncbi:hypothetical protein ACRALDRAFT_205945 [Sodiomyces alcalophilus JCM 7366]|uniref:uncharacterized protein n=1 Tax=Sodiomyces alcalophilus JCM 7366 TaxID=591952 RepID=UPI0039B6A2C6